MSTRSHDTGRAASLVLTLAIVELTLTTAWIHLSLGGTLFTLNAIGYVGLATAVAFSAAWPIGLIGRLAWLPRLGLGLYTLATIAGYLVMGPYFALGWIAKAVEITILTVLVADVALRPPGRAEVEWRGRPGTDPRYPTPS